MALRANGTNSGESVSQQAAASAVGQHFGFIRRFFERRLGSDPCSEELAQVTAIKCIEAHDKVRARDRFFAYVRAIARNVFFDHLRAKRRADRFDDLCSLEDAAASPADAASKAERNARLADAVELLPRGLRDVVQLRYWEQLTSPQIADRLGLTAAGVRTRLARARRLLAPGLGDVTVQSVLPP